MKRSIARVGPATLMLLVGLITGWWIQPAALQGVVYHDLSCRCCARWAQYLAENGFELRTEILSPLEVIALRRELGVPEQLDACHTAVIEGRFVIGHVEATTIRSLLGAEGGNLRGIGVVGMPVESPGMEIPGVEAEAHEIVGIRQDGTWFVCGRVGADPARGGFSRLVSVGDTTRRDP